MEVAVVAVLVVAAAVVVVVIVAPRECSTSRCLNRRAHSTHRGMIVVSILAQSAAWGRLAPLPLPACLPAAHLPRLSFSIVCL